MDPAALARLDVTLAVLQQDHQGTDESASEIGIEIESDTLAPVGDVFDLDSLDLDLLLVAAPPVTRPRHPMWTRTSGWPLACCGERPGGPGPASVSR